MEWTKKKIAGASVGGLFVLAAIGSAFDDTPADGGKAAESPAPAVAAKTVSEPAPMPSLRLTVPEDRIVHTGKVTLTGSVAADNGSVQGVAVKVGGKLATVKDGHWTRAVTVKQGQNPIDVVATKGTYRQDVGGLIVTRHRTKAEIAEAAAKHRAQVAANKAKRKAAAAAKQASYKAGAKTIPYNQLAKNPDRYAGQRVTYRGQIMQIQEDFGSTVILLSVTDMGYDIWDDNIWVDYPGTIKGAEDDIITVYGNIEGEKSYETQIGGETYVPQMTAKYVVE